MNDPIPNILLIALLTLIVVWFFIGCWLIIKNPDMSSVPPERKRGFWRWLFLCAMTVLATDTATLMTHHGSVDQDATPVRAAILFCTTGIAFLILFILGPLFFRRLGGLAIVGWIIAVVVLVYACQPTF